MRASKIASASSDDGTESVRLVSFSLDSFASTEPAVSSAGSWEPSSTVDSDVVDLDACSSAMAGSSPSSAGSTSATGGSGGAEVSSTSADSSEFSDGGSGATVACSKVESFCPSDRFGETVEKLSGNG